MQLLKHKRYRILLGSIAITLLAFMYLFQRLDFAHYVGIYSSSHRFVANRLVRFLLNDAACLMLVAAIFNKAAYLRLSFWIFLAELFILLPLYFAFKLTLEGDTEISSPLLSQIHRMIVNPLLMIVLIAALFYQDSTRKCNS
ncbi:MAG TPA: exosortase F system-associated protein [Cyclobacteriaceae bacterium]|nr:exosortase F system-associated protein [Cyclobacteriaceae bacterium]